MVRGDVHSITLPRRRGHVQRGRRFGRRRPSDRPPDSVDRRRLRDVQSIQAASFHPEIEVAGEPSRVMCEMVRAVDARMLGERVGHLTLDEIRAVDDGLELVLDLG